MTRSSNLADFVKSEKSVDFEFLGETINDHQSKIDPPVQMTFNNTMNSDKLR